MFFCVGAVVVVVGGGGGVVVVVVVVVVVDKGMSDTAVVEHYGKRTFSELLSLFDRVNSPL